MKDIYRKNECDFVGTIAGIKNLHFLKNIITMMFLNYSSLVSY